MEYKNMEKILVFGNNQSIDWSQKLSNYNVQFEEFESFTLNENGVENINKIVIDKLGNQAVKAVILDFDGIIVPQKEERCLITALAIRLSLFETMRNACVPIFFASKIDQGLFRNFQYSTILFTEGISVNTYENIIDAIDIVEPLDAKQYKTRFLDIIKVLPNSTEGNHSLANQWGADALGRFFFGNETSNQMIEKARLSMYFRYVRASALKIQDIEKLVNGEIIAPYTDIKVPPINAKGKKVLLIDDEADKGWSDVLSKLLVGATFDTINERVKDYNPLSDSNKDKIENGDYDLIFLDLRMNGTEEEDNVRPEEFSGMKILKAIKNHNKGTQVIMLTASNKAWNMKALLDAGADGYYIKESPEYAFSLTYSQSNAEGLCKSIERCFKRGYLRNIYSNLKNVKKLIKENNFFGDKKDEILNSIDIAYDLLNQSGERPEYKAYSYLQLFLVIEEFVKLPSIIDESDSGVYLYNGENRYRILKDKTPQNKTFRYNSIIDMQNGHYSLQRGQYIGRFIDTNFLVSALLIFKFKKDNSAEWTKIYKKRNDIAHPKEANVTIDDFKKIIHFMLYIFNPKNDNWRELNEAFEDISMESSIEALKEKYRK